MTALILGPRGQLSKDSTCLVGYFCQYFRSRRGKREVKEGYHLWPVGLSEPLFLLDLRLWILPNGILEGQEPGEMGDVFLHPLAILSLTETTLPAPSSRLSSANSKHYGWRSQSVLD